jgi:choline dehydrogenase-like flavoprotein
MAHLIEDVADFVIVGTGAGGATAARVLAAAGHDVLMVEEGPKLTQDERPRDLLRGMGAAVRGMGTQATVGKTPIPLLQGRLVGGSTAINSGIVWRMPDDVRSDWKEHHGLDWLVDEGEMHRIYAQIEEELEVAETAEEIFGQNSRKMADACDALGLPGKAMTRNAARCRGSSRCLQGCPTRARQSMDTSYVPRAIGDGARLHTLCRVKKVTMQGDRATGVAGDVVEKHTRRKKGTFRIRARSAVIVSAGVLHTPTLLDASGIRHHLLGQRFQAHPGLAVVARFDEPIRMGFGATQGYEVPMRDRGFKLETLSLPPEMLAARLPGTGARWQQKLSELDHYAQWCVQVRMKAKGRVKRGFGGSPKVAYEPVERDVAATQEAVALLCKMFFAVGATEVYPGVGHLPEVMTDPKEADAIADARLRRPDFHYVASHLFGTTCAGTDPAKAVVGEDLAVHGAEGLYVMDASVFPTNMGVNPQHSIMTVVWRAAEKLAESARRSEAA